jgi:hypothetical protein
MNPNSFSKNTWVKYESYVAQVRFICSSYITICICPNQEKTRQTCMIIYSEDWKNVFLLKESEK